MSVYVEFAGEQVRTISLGLTTTGVPRPGGLATDVAGWAAAAADPLWRGDTDRIFTEAQDSDSDIFDQLPPG
jgi:hypothetical protein